MVSLEADMVQFMLFTPLPVTTLYRDLQRRGLLREDLPFEEWHGQKELSWRHPAFPGDSAARCLDSAFERDYLVNSSSIYRVVETAFRGYRRLAAAPRRDACLEERLRRLARRVRDWSPVLADLARNGVNEVERRRARELEKEIALTMGAPGLVGSMARVAVRAFAAAWRLRIRLVGDSIQPRTIVTRFRNGASGVATVPVAERGRDLEVAASPSLAAAAASMVDPVV
jgi:hypothetical protein